MMDSPPTERSYRTVLWTLAALGLLLDQGSKYLIFHWLYVDHVGESRFALVPGAFELLTQFTGAREVGDGVMSWLRSVSGQCQPRVNHGALFGLGGEYVYLANSLFMGVSVVAAAAILIWSLRGSSARDPVLCCSLGLIFAGTLGNLYDRAVFGGVRDFLHWFYAFEWPVFNIADCCLVCGAGLLLVQAFWAPPVEETALSATAEAKLAPSVESVV